MAQKIVQNFDYACLPKSRLKSSLSLWRLLAPLSFSIIIYEDGISLVVAKYLARKQGAKLIALDERDLLPDFYKDILPLPYNEVNPSILHPPLPTPPKISIIIACLDEIDALKVSLRAIAKCGYENIEVVVVDSGEVDKSSILAKTLGGAVESKLIQVPKCGISDAFNHGVLNAGGEYINFQGAGDLLEDISYLAGFLQAAKYDLVSGRIKRVGEENPHEILFFSPYLKHYSYNGMLYKMNMPHQGLFTHHDFFKRHGTFDKTKRYSMDYFLLLCAYKDRGALKILHLDAFISRWAEGGIGAGCEGDILKEYRDNRVQSQACSLPSANAIYYFQLFKLRLRKILLGG